MKKQREPNIISTIEDMDNGTLAQKLSTSLAAATRGAIGHGKKGRVTLTIDIEQIGEAAQVQLTHKISSVVPTLRGKRSEEDTTQTAMFVNENGYVSIAPDAQVDFFNELKEQA